MKAFLLTLLTLVLVGCGSTKVQEVIRVEYKYIELELPKQLTSECKPPKPMNEVQYLKLTQQERENYLAQYVLVLFGEIKKCDGKITSIKKLVEAQNSIASKPITK